MNAVALPSWEQARARLVSTVPQFYELEPGGALALDLGDDGWLLEVRSDGQLLCQHGIAMDDVKSLMCDGTTEDLGTDEVRAIGEGKTRIAVLNVVRRAPIPVIGITTEEAFAVACRQGKR